MLKTTQKRVDVTPQLIESAKQYEHAYDCTTLLAHNFLALLYPHVLVKRYYAFARDECLRTGVYCCFFK